MTGMDFLEKYQEELKGAPKRALIALYKKSQGEISVQEAYKIIVDNASFRELTSLYAGQGRKLKKLMKQEQTAIHFLADLKQLALDEIKMALLQVE